MKVLLINGSPHEHGCTWTALSEIASVLEAESIQTELVHVGHRPIMGCTGCGACRGGNGCVYRDDPVCAIVEKAAEADGFVFGSPVHYAAASGAMTALMDRCFYSGGAAFAYKPAACIVSCRRGGATAALDQLNKYLTISNMPLVSSSYWSMVHGTTPEEVRQDLEGMQTMRRIGKNMAWLLRCIEAGRMAGIDRPAEEPKVRTNFIR